jgi:RNA polymerase-binding transcription factor
MRYQKSGEVVSIEQARVRLERRRKELKRLLDWMDTDPSGPQPAFLPVDPFECDGGVEQLELRAVERSLQRIANQTFGECDCCGGPIERARLAAVPWTRCCIECIAFWEGALRTAEAENAGCATCRAELTAGDVLASVARDAVLARR